MKVAYFAGGCFWCIASFIESLDGVIQVISGYCGGKEVNPTYESVKEGLTGHRERIKVVYEEDKISYQELLKVFLESVDPFDEGGQFIDRGHSYTLAIYYNDLDEYTEAIRQIKTIEEESGKKVFIAIEKFDVFYEAEEYHQNYHLKNPEAFQEEMEKSGRKKRA